MLTSEWMNRWVVRKNTSEHKQHKEKNVSYADWLDGTRREYNEESIERERERERKKEKKNDGTIDWVG